VSGCSEQVAFVLGSSTGGIGRHVASLAGALVDRGLKVLVCGPATTEAQFKFSALGAAFSPVEIPASPNLSDVTAILALRRALSGFRPDVVHAHGLRAGLVAGWARPKGVPLVVTWHNVVSGSGLKGRLLRLLEQRVARSTTITLAASSDLVRRAAGAGARDVRLGPVAAPMLPAPRRGRDQVRADLGVTGEQPLILSVGRLHPQKGYDLLITAAARWRTRTPPPVVAIAGSGPAYLRLATQISTERAPVTLLGHRDDVSDLLAGADLAVVSSRWEARQLFAQEALRAGVPLVATEVGGLPELVGDAAVWVPPGDADVLANAVAGLLDDRRARERYEHAGPARAATWPTEDQTVDQVTAVYTELTGREDGRVAG
jgi:glycosyltransferase involved in cell wall biosynthesis